MRPSVLIVTVALLSGCAAATSDRAMPCPRLAGYAPEFQARATDALEALTPGDPLRRLVEDYGRLRAEVRAACP